MQISSQLSSAGYASYQRNRNTKYAVGNSKNEASEPDGSSKAYRSEDGTNYDGLYSAWEAQRGNRDASMVAPMAEGEEERQYEDGTPLLDEPKETTNGVRQTEDQISCAQSVSNVPDVSETDPIEVSEEAFIDFRKMLEDKINEMFLKIQNGDIEPTYQIGAQSFTLKEWDKFLEEFDSIEDAIRELIRAEQEKNKAGQIQKAQAVFGDASILLTAESSSCSYPASDPEEEDIFYITCYTEEGIFCRKAGQTEGYEWAIIFEDREQYDKVMEFIGRFPSDWNLRFAAHENFWTDFLNDEIDIDAFMEFMSGTNKGIPDYSITVGDSMYIDKEKIQWAKYLNPFGAKFYTAAEMYQMQAELIAENQAKLSKVTDWSEYEEIYKKNHPEYNGERICCEYPGGPLYTVREIAQIMWENYLKELRK